MPETYRQLPICQRLCLESRSRVQGLLFTDFGRGGGVARVAVTVVKVTNGTRGQIEFEDEPDPGDFPLTFDPFGQLILIDRKGVM